MDLSAATRDFLASRRARITPSEAGLPVFGGKRRVPGLRREEVALLAGMSVDYYTRIERGNLRGVSDEVLHALAEALRLDEAERAHLFDLSRAANAGGAARARTRRASAQLRPAIQRVLDAMETTPAIVRNGRLDIIGANLLGRALYSPVFDFALKTGADTVNTARFQFLAPEAASSYWGDKAARIRHDAVAILRTEAGRNPYDKGLSNLVGELSTRSVEFRDLWANHDVRFHRTGTKAFNHPVAGRLDLDYEALILPADEGLQMNVYTTPVGSPSSDGLRLLAAWADVSLAEVGGSAGGR